MNWHPHRRLGSRQKSGHQFATYASDHIVGWGSNGGYTVPQGWPTEHTSERVHEHSVWTWVGEEYCDGVTSMCMHRERNAEAQGISKINKDWAHRQRMGTVDPCSHPKAGKSLPAFDWPLQFFLR